MPTLYVPHGGGPCFFMDGPPPFDPGTWAGMADFLRRAATLERRPRAIVVISGHWDAPVPTVNAAVDHTLFYDYYGFPEHTYRLRYPAKGSPEMAARVRALLEGAGIATAEDATRGLDHGVFVPFLLMFPDAGIPIVQLSLRTDMDAAAHLAIGRALAPLRDDGVLIIGTGMSYHNLRKLQARGRPDAEAREFDDWLTDAVTAPRPADRDARLASWASAPSARAAHPEADHLIPLHVVAGAAGGDVGRRVYHEDIFGKPVSAYRFG
jgi:aromatic ring-opening dioxygenase catalytic subunit (LigB family)